MGSKDGCHTGNPLVFEAKGVKVYAGGTNRNGGWHKMSPVPDLALGPIGVIHSARTIDVLPEGSKSSYTLVGGNTPIVIEIDWPDYSIPSNLGPSWWKALVEDIETKNIKSISTQCMGGHGRTGVQLAILAHLMIPKAKHEWKNAHDLIKWVRGNFCEHAVEAKSQQTYIADVCGIPEGDSAIVVTQPQWSNFDYTADNLLTEDELRAEQVKIEREEKKAKAAAKKARAAAKKGKKGKGNNPKKHTLDDFFDDDIERLPFGSDNKVSSPVEKGWTIVECCDCHHNEWRKADRNTFTTPCSACGFDGGFVQVDREFLDGNKTRLCLVTDEMYHQIEMYDSQVSYVGEAMRRGMSIRTNQKGIVTIKIGNKYIPIHLLKRDGDNIVSMKKTTQKIVESRSAIQGMKFMGRQEREILEE